MADIPSWLRPFLDGSYFAHCRAHMSSKNERNHFCVDCVEGPLCHTGWQEHTEHRTLQVRRASHMDAVRINDIHKLIDTSGIQPYTINGAKIIFLLSRPQSKLAKGSLRCCEMCGRSISDPVRFCSISCKLACVQSGYDDTAIVHRVGKSDALHVDEDESPPPHAQELGFKTVSPSVSENGNGSRLGKRSAEEEEEEEEEEVVGFKRSKLHIVVNEEQEDGERRGTPGTPSNASPNSVLSEMMTPSTCRSMPKSPGVLLASPSTPRSSHRKGTPYRSPLF